MQLTYAKLSGKREMVQNGSIKIFNIDDFDYLRFRNQNCVPSVVDLKELILHEAHDIYFSMHPGGMKMYRDSQELYWWPRTKK
ncbi:NBS-LRR resistance-like protein [Gossypium australe]|uniref:NBS-LRR resistance-like protein n=1 Tax=Gossypium australe TaxID=47621 RepID=A0A5B6UYD4_9ROSI|nr:NBS-LRR resistance-like protein [Gossypium australe]